MADPDEEQFSLCWNNFNTNLSAGFHESLCRGDLVDVTLAAEGQLVKAHRLVLSVCSPYFQKMFTQMPANQHAFGKLNKNILIFFVHLMHVSIVINLMRLLRPFRSGKTILICHLYAFFLLF